MMVHQNDTLRALFERHSIHKYPDKPTCERTLAGAIDAPFDAPTAAANVITAACLGKRPASMPRKEGRAICVIEAKR